MKKLFALFPALLLAAGVLVAMACGSGSKYTGPPAFHAVGAGTAFPSTASTNILVNGDTYASDMTAAINSLQASTNADLLTLSTGRNQLVQCNSTDGGTCTVSVPLSLNASSIQYLWIEEVAGKNSQHCKYSIGVKCAVDAGNCVVFKASAALETCAFTDAGADAAWFTPAIGIDAGFTRVKLGGESRLSVTLDGGPPINKVFYQVFTAP